MELTGGCGARRQRRGIGRTVIKAVALVVAVVIIAGCGSRPSGPSRSEGRAQFDEHLTAYDLAAAEQVLGTVKTGDAWSRDAETRLSTAKKNEERYQAAKAQVDRGEWKEPLWVLKDLGGYRDAPTLLSTAHFELAKLDFAEKKWMDAKLHLDSMSEIRPEVDEMRKAIAEGLTAQYYKEGMEARALKEWSRAEGLLTSAKAAGGKVPANIDAVIKEMGDLAQKEAAANRLAQIKGQQNYYTSGTVQLAVGNAEFRTRLSNKVAGENGAFVLVYASIKNGGTRSEHANPVRFKLSTPDGYTVPTTSEMYSLNNSFDAVDLSRGQSTAGWLAFYIKRSETYTLHYEGFNSSASKEIAPEW